MDRKNTIGIESGSDSSRYILAVDLGSGALKAALVSSKGKVVSSGDERITTYLLTEGGAEQDADQ